jgi:hypothetical protein
MAIIGLAVGIVMVIMATTEIANKGLFAISANIGNHSSQDNKSFMDGDSMAMVNPNMTFGSSLQNAKMHLMEAIMDLKEGDNKGALMQLNMTNQEIVMHENELEKMLINK